MLVLALATLRGSIDFPKLRVTAWQVIGFYYVAGLVGGAIFGLLRRLRSRYVGRYLSAYLVLLLVYGGGTAVFYESMNRHDSDPPPLLALVGIWALVCLVLAPFYVYLFRDPTD